ncbi:MAG: lmo0937 family membrane protein [Burkholderiales bacterium]
MLFKIALVLLSLWLIGVVGVYNVGDLVHVLLLVGLMFLLLAFLRARDAATRRAAGGSADRP